MNEKSAQERTVRTEPCLDPAGRCRCDRSHLHLRSVSLHLSTRDLLDLIMQVREREEDFYGIE